MIVPATVRRRFNNISTELEIVSRSVRNTVLGYCDRHGFAYTGRPKSVESLAEKIESGRYSCWEELDDLFGCTIVVPTLACEDGVIAFLQETFIQVDLRRRGASQKNPAEFRFDATRYYGRLRPVIPPAIDQPRPEFGLTFEVQIRSAFEHAWSVTTHAIYKSHDVNWKAKRLAAQLKAAVEQLDALVLGLESSTEHIVAHRWPDLDFQANVVARLTQLEGRGVIPTDLLPRSMSRFAENLFALIRSSAACPKRHDERAKFQEDAISVLEAELVTLGPDNMPHTLSLFQLALGTLVKRSFLAPRLFKYVPLITPDLLHHFPDTAKFSDGAFQI